MIYVTIRTWSDGRPWAWEVRNETEFVTSFDQSDLQAGAAQLEAELERHALSGLPVEVCLLEDADRGGEREAVPIEKLIERRVWEDRLAMLRWQNEP